MSQVQTQPEPIFQLLALLLEADPLHHTYHTGEKCRWDCGCEWHYHEGEETWRRDSCCGKHGHEKLRRWV